MSDDPSNLTPQPPTGGGGAKLPPGRALGGGKRPLPSKSSSNRFGTLEPKMRPRVLIIGATFLVVFLYINWYFLVKRPIEERQRAAEMEMRAAEEARRTAEANLQKQQLEADTQKTALARGIIIVKTNPPGATVTLDEGTVLKSPATFKSVKLGAHPIKIALEGYEVVDTEAVVKEGETTDLGTVNLVRSLGNLQLTSFPTGVDYTLKEGDRVVSSGKTPATLKALPSGEYSVMMKRDDYEQTQTAVVIRNQTVTSRIDFVYGTVQVTTNPPGATVKLGEKNMGQTPVTLIEIKPGDTTFTISLFGYKPQTITVKAEPRITVPISATLEISRDLVNSVGMEMIWIAPANFWAGKNEVTQSEFEKVMGYRSGTFAGSRRPVETVTWTDAAAFCKKLTEMDRSAGKLPPGYYYALPTELQWETLAADAALEDGVTSSGETDRSGTDVVGTKKPNKFGIHDVRGNVWEMMSTPFDGGGQRRVIRGGSWLSSKSNTLDLAYREGILENYRDRTIGFRCVLVKD